MDILGLLVLGLLRQRRPGRDIHGQGMHTRLSGDGARSRLPGRGDQPGGELLARGDQGRRDWLSRVVEDHRGRRPVHEQWNAPLRPGWGRDDEVARREGAIHNQPLSAGGPSTPRVRGPQDDPHRQPRENLSQLSLVRWIIGQHLRRRPGRRSERGYRLDRQDAIPEVGKADRIDDAERWPTDLGWRLLQDVQPHQPRCVRHLLWQRSHPEARIPGLLHHLVLHRGPADRALVLLRRKNLSI